MDPQHPEQGTRKVPFMRELFIEQDDFMENPPKSFFRLAPGPKNCVKVGTAKVASFFVIGDGHGRGTGRAAPVSGFGG